MVDRFFYWLRGLRAIRRKGKMRKIAVLTLILMFALVNSAYANWNYAHTGGREYRVMGAGYINAKLHKKESQEPRKEVSLPIKGPSENSVEVTDVVQPSVDNSSENVPEVEEAQNRQVPPPRADEVEKIPPTIPYEQKGQASMIFDAKNRLLIEYATKNIYTYYENKVNYIGGSIKYICERVERTAQNMLGKILNVFYTDDAGNPLTGADISTTLNGWTLSGYVNFADKAPLVPYESLAIPYVADTYFGGWYHYNDRISAQEFRYAENGTLESIRYNAWSAGLQDHDWRPARYAYRIDTFCEDGTRDIDWFNDPAPTNYEPTFIGKVVKDKYNQFFINVKTAYDRDGNDISEDFTGKTFLLTTRYMDTTETNHGGQPDTFENQALETAIGGGAAQFTALDWSKLVNQNIRVQGHLMTNAKSERGIYYKGDKVGVFSAFEIKGW